MTMSQKKTAIASAFLVGVLAFSGCGAANEAKDAASSVAESAQQVSTEGLQAFADDYTRAMTQPIEGVEETVAELQKDADFMGAMSTLADLNGSDLVGYEKAIAQLPTGQKEALKNFSGEKMNPLYGMIDYGDLSEDAKLALDFSNYALASVIAEGASQEKLGDNTVNLDDLKLDGTRVEVSMKALQEQSGTSEKGREFFAKIPAVLTDGSWKLDGEKYYERMNEYMSQ